MPSYLQCLKQNPTVQSVQLAGSTLLHFLFLLLHALQTSHRHLHSASAKAIASLEPSNSSDCFNKHEQVPPLPDLTDNAIGDVTCADAQWCPVDAILRRIGMMLLAACWVLGISWHLHLCVPTNKGIDLQACSVDMQQQSAFPCRPH